MSDIEILSFVCNVATFLIAVLAFRKYTENKTIDNLKKHLLWIKKTVVDRDDTSWWASSTERWSGFDKESGNLYIQSYINEIQEDLKKLGELYFEFIFRYNDGKEIESIRNIIFLLRFACVNFKVQDSHSEGNSRQIYRFNPMLNEDQKKQFYNWYRECENEILNIQKEIHYKTCFNIQ